ncbi:hypothetical protein F4810DRAFT_711139 [Camillea tinctor]|nr:hypothetical protein F4810DRAFT_711139 [Camillea tinctor]
MMDGWDDEADHKPTFPAPEIGAGRVNNLEFWQKSSSRHGGGGGDDGIDTNVDSHIYEDGLDTAFSGTSPKDSHTRSMISPTERPDENPDENVYGHISLDQDPLQSYQSASFDPASLPDLSSGSTHNPLDNTDAFSISSWEEDDGGDNDHGFKRYHYDQHDELAERIAHLTRTINAHAVTCLEVSSRAIDLARENAHLATQAGGALDAYVLRPCLRLVGASSASAIQMLMRTYSGASDSAGELENGGHNRGAIEGRIQALQRALANCKNGRDMAMIGQTGAAVGMSIKGSFGSGKEKEVNRLKDRLVEQDAVLRESSRHIRRLIQERDRLRKQLELRQHARAGGNANQPPKSRKASADFEQTTVRGSTPAALAKMRAREMTASQSADPYIEEGGLQNDEDEEEAKNRERQLTAQLEELRVLMDQMALHEVDISNLNQSDSSSNNNDSNSHNGQKRDSSSSSTSSSFSSSFFSAPEDEEKEQKKGNDKEKAGRRQQKQMSPPPPLQRKQQQRQQQQKQYEKQRAPPLLPYLDIEEDPEDPEWTLL